MTEFQTSRAKRVCEKCFGGDVLAMKRYADAYLSGGHTSVPPLGAAFRELLPGRARRAFWEKAQRQLAAHLASAPVVTTGSLPGWTALAGGESQWRDWAKRQSVRCCRRAREWVTKTGSSETVPSRAQWQEAVLEAIRRCDGRGYFSRLPLTLKGMKPTDPRWPSVDHLVDPAHLALALEQRLFNDMKTVLSAEEFRLAVGHLSVVLASPPRVLEDHWRPDRGFGTPEKPDEPPLPQGS